MSCAQWIFHLVCLLIGILAAALPGALIGSLIGGKISIIIGALLSGYGFGVLIGNLTYDFLAVRLFKKSQNRMD